MPKTFTEYRMVHVDDSDSSEPIVTGYVGDSTISSYIHNNRRVMERFYTYFDDWVELLKVEAYGWQSNEWCMIPMWYVAR